jgi:hypothetical protein
MQVLSGADVRAEDEWKQTALHKAAEGGFDEVVKVLCHYGALLNSLDGLGRTAVHLAANRGNVGALRELAAHGAIMSSYDRERRTPEDIARVFNQQEALKFLKERDALVALAFIASLATDYAKSRPRAMPYSSCLDEIWPCLALSFTLLMQELSAGKEGGTDATSAASAEGGEVSQNA